MTSLRHANFLSQLKHKCAQFSRDYKNSRVPGDLFIGLYVGDFSQIGTVNDPYLRRMVYQSHLKDAIDYFGKNAIFIYSSHTDTLYYRAGFGRKLTQAGVKW